MRAAQKGRRRTQVSRVLSVPAPVGGWNARDSLADMQPTDAVSLDNFFCTPFDVVLRSGYSQRTTGITGNVNTLCSYSPPSGSIKLFAAAGANIYDVSAAGAVGAAVATGKTSDKWQHVNFGTAGGNFLYMVNGSDAPLMYDGAAWSNPAITVATPANFINVAAFAKRLWFCEKNTLKVWYLPTLSIAGAASPIDFSGLFNRGGYIMAMGDWSLDAGYGMDDYAVFVTSEGQVAIYKGTDPATAATWALIGVYDIGAPIGRRCLMKYAGDVLVICKDGLAPLSRALMSSRVNSKEMISDKIQHVMSDYTTLYGANFGWESAIFPRENMLIVNVPASTAASYQLVMNTITGAWSRFIGWDAACFELHGDELYFGGNGAVCKAWDTDADNAQNINFNAQQSFNYLGGSGQLKKINMIRPIISTDGVPVILLGVNVDFDQSAPLGMPTFSPQIPAPGTWDSSTWDGGGVWGGEMVIKKDWQTTFGIGNCVSAHMKGACRYTKLRWIATDYLVDFGGVI